MSVRSRTTDINARLNRSTRRDEEWFGGRQAGIEPDDLAERLGLSGRWAKELEGRYRCETSLAGSGDCTVPKFAHDAEYIDLILDAEPRGFGRIDFKTGEVIYNP